jgi:hypothetical protein
MTDDKKRLRGTVTTGGRRIGKVTLTQEMIDMLTEKSSILTDLPFIPASDGKIRGKAFDSIVFDESHIVDANANAYAAMATKKTNVDIPKTVDKDAW